MNKDLKLSIITSEESIKDVLFILMASDIEKMISGLPDYSFDYLYDYLKTKCWVYGAYADGEVKGIFVFRWLSKTHVMGHFKTLDNQYSWNRFYKDTIRPTIAKHAKYQYGCLREDQSSLVRLYRRYGYNPEWNENINRYEYLIKL